MKKLILVFIFILGFNLFGEEKIFFLEDENLKINDVMAKLIKKIKLTGRQKLL